jgi:hypothetical protein
MRFSPSVLSVLSALVAPGSNFAVALPRQSFPNDELSHNNLLPGGRAIYGDVQLIDGLVTDGTEPNTTPAASSCFPALDFVMPANPPADLNNWWCSATTEYAFLGFSYEVEACM